MTSRVLGGDSCFNCLLGRPWMADALERARSLVLGGGLEAALFGEGFLSEVSAAAMDLALALLPGVSRTLIVSDLLILHEPQEVP